MPTSFDKQKPRSRRLRWIVPVTLLLIGGGVAAQQYFQRNNTPALRTAVIELGDIERTVTALGKLKPKEYVDVGTQVSGQLDHVHVQIGDVVKRGDLIAEIDPTVYATRVRNDEASLESLKAQLVQQQAELNLARTQLARNLRLLEARATRQEVVDENKAAVEVAAARIASTKAQIKASEATLAGNVANLGYTKIHAPMDGTVVSESAVEGQTVNASQSAPVIVRIADLQTMTVWAQVSEADIVRVQPGMPAYFTTLGNPERRWRGVVRQLMPTPEIINDVVLYNVLIDVDNSEQALMTDMTVQVFFVLGEARGVPIAPLAALQAAGKHHQAQVLTGHSLESRQVRIGVSNRTAAQIVDGLQPGETVVLGQTAAASTAGAGRRRPGMGPRL
jgi:macrolide-specific efflux system membrane fusion protein